MAHGRSPDATGIKDAQLVAAARAGDMASLGLLFERYRPRLLALAVSLVGYRAEAEDAVHDTFVTALARLRELGDPGAVGGWLHAIVRNRCLMELRSGRRRTEVDEGQVALEDLPDEARVEDRIESRQLRDWIWSALGKLPETVRVVMMLRYFGSYDSYDEIAKILGVPVGTVRSRLFDGKARLATLLLAEAGVAPSDQRTLEEERREFLVHSFAEIFRGHACDAYFDAHAKDLVINWSGLGVTHGREHLRREIEGDYADGVVMTPQRVLAAADVTVLEGRFRNPPEDPHHCPPGLVMVMLHEDSLVTRMHIHLSPRPPATEIA